MTDCKSVWRGFPKIRLVESHERVKDLLGLRTRNEFRIYGSLLGDLLLYTRHTTLSASR